MIRQKINAIVFLNKPHFVFSGLPGHANAGPDYVDYGAYTGGYGAYGWYTDHPVLISGY